MFLTQLMVFARRLWMLPALCACGAISENKAAPAGPSGSAEAPRPAAEPSLYGSWQIVAINGSPPAAGGPPPAITFSRSRYGGSTGCNSFGGTGLMVGDRWFGEPPIATQQGCGPLRVQEEAIIGIASGGPRIAFSSATEATLTSGEGSLRLRRSAGETADAAEREPMLLAGTQWEIRSVDGRPADAWGVRDRILLSFDADRWTLTGGCGPMTGSWRQSGRSLTMEVLSSPPRDCSGTKKALDQALRDLAAAAPQQAVGPNREFVLAGGGHWLTGDFVRSAAASANAAIVGEWRVDTVNGAAPQPMPRPASLIFGRASYAVWDGCNHTEGVMITSGGQLFTRGSGLTTLANCMEDPVRPRIGAIVASQPRIAKIETGGLALVSPAGTLRLTRLSGRSFGTGEELGLRGARTIRIMKPNARLNLLGTGRFEITLDCGRIEGDWRGGQPARFSPDPLERTAPNCRAEPGSDAFQLGQFFTGNVLAVTGPNRDIVLLVNESRSLAGWAN